MSPQSHTTEKRVSTNRVYWTLTILAAALIANPLVLSRLVRTEAPPLPRVTVSDPGHQQVKAADIKRDDDVGKPGSMRSTMGYVGLSQLGNTSGRSPDELRLFFDSRAVIHGVHISVDVPTEFDLVEIAVGVNNDPGYGIQRTADYLHHVTYANSTGTSGSLDETIWIPGGIEVGPGDFVGLGGWVGTTTMQETSVFPEMIVFYEWIDEG